jgi:hypothetical protein
MLRHTPIHPTKHPRRFRRAVDPEMPTEPTAGRSAARTTKAADGASPADVTVPSGDAFDLLPTLPANSVDLLITSPSYWGHRTYHQKHNWAVLAEWTGTGKKATDVPSYEWYRKADVLPNHVEVPDRRRRNVGRLRARIAGVRVG